MSRTTADKPRLSWAAIAKGPPQRNYQPPPTTANARNSSVSDQTTASTKSAWSRGPPTSTKDAATQSTHPSTPSNSTILPTSSTTTHPDVVLNRTVKLPPNSAWAKGPPASSEKPSSISAAADFVVKTSHAAQDVSSQMWNGAATESIGNVHQDPSQSSLASHSSSRNVGTASNVYPSTTVDLNRGHIPPAVQHPRSGVTVRLPVNSAWRKGPLEVNHAPALQFGSLDDVFLSSQFNSLEQTATFNSQNATNSSPVVPLYDSSHSHTRSSSLSKPAKLDILRMFQATQGEPSLASDNLQASRETLATPLHHSMNEIPQSFDLAASLAPLTLNVSQELATATPSTTPSKRETLDILRTLFQSSPSTTTSSRPSSSPSGYSPQSHSSLSPHSTSPEPPAELFYSSSHNLIPPLAAEHRARSFNEDHTAPRPVSDAPDAYLPFLLPQTDVRYVNTPGSTAIQSPLGRNASPPNGFYSGYRFPPSLMSEGSRSSFIAPVPLNLGSPQESGPSEVIESSAHQPSFDSLDGDPMLPRYEPPSITPSRPSSGYYDLHDINSQAPRPYPIPFPTSFSATPSPQGREERLGDTLAELEAVNARLQKAFRDEAEYRYLLSFGGPQAHSILDTFQTLLDICQPEGETRRNLIVATRRLSTKTDLYPRSFDLEGVQLTSSSPFASGSFADIHMGKLHGETVCLKVIRVYQSSVYKHIVKTTAREAILWGQLSHPNLLPFYGLHRVGSQLALVSPWADNGRVVDFLKEHPDADRVLLVSDIVEGLAYLHANDVVHGDLKGANVLVDHVGRAYLADFGLSAVTDPQILQWTSNSSAASRGGTVRYQAPELNVPESIEDENSESGSAAFHIHNTTASDIYALSCVCYEILTGRVPFFEFGREHTVMVNVGAGIRPSRPATLIEQWREWGLSDSMWDLMTACWRHEPSDRLAINEVVLLLSLMKPDDPRPPSNWADSAIRFRGSSAQKPLSLEELENILTF